MPYRLTTGELIGLNPATVERKLKALYRHKRATHATWYTNPHRVIVTYHGHEVAHIVFDRQGNPYSVILNYCGHYTRTTRARMNDILTGYNLGHLSIRGRRDVIAIDNPEPGTMQRIITWTEPASPIELIIATRRTTATRNVGLETTIPIERTNSRPTRTRRHRRAREREGTLTIPRIEKRNGVYHL